ncbi:uncharacterized protein NECHADRAFT_85654 [Fusarium vanettenii 77-13-4]|uniref:Uncharacterized protein n=1 Tax=Fusarium vanettenii (strain ATCC MYA-4622 / CBS 123669 / FGSC 9596 / NRRL 45880 / 77-13-4) TaxID=660122 RepID=C7ZPA8_FUSV7|nr:uncharacterized protein NECHADRAFT_85654 [Fusarium vanettenii 77-13-4]EEU34319.1 predicted protein [Fusarium vanettenii 77-13-4]
MPDEAPTNLEYFQGLIYERYPNDGVRKSRQRRKDANKENINVLVRGGSALRCFYTAAGSEKQVLPSRRYESHDGAPDEGGISWRCAIGPKANGLACLSGARLGTILLAQESTTTAVFPFHRDCFDVLKTAHYSAAVDPDLLYDTIRINCGRMVSCFEYVRTTLGEYIAPASTTPSRTFWRDQMLDSLKHHNTTADTMQIRKSV